MVELLREAIKRKEVIVDRKDICISPNCRLFAGLIMHQHSFCSDCELRHSVDFIEAFWMNAQFGFYAVADCSSHAAFKAL